MQAVLREGGRAVELAPEVGAYHALLVSAIAGGLPSPALARSPGREEALAVARVHAEAALRLDEKKENAALELARIEWLAGHLEAAEAQARASIAVDRCFYQSHQVLAFLLLARGRLEEAREEAVAVERLGAGAEAARLRQLLEEAGSQGAER